MILDERGWGWWEYRCATGHSFRLLIHRRETYCRECGAASGIVGSVREEARKQDWSPRRDRLLAAGR